MVDDPGGELASLGARHIGEQCEQRGGVSAARNAYEYRLAGGQRPGDERCELSLLAGRWAAGA